MAVFSILVKMFFFRNTKAHFLMILFCLCDSCGKNTQECHSSLRIFFAMLLFERESTMYAKIELIFF